MITINEYKFGNYEYLFKINIVEKIFLLLNLHLFIASFYLIILLQLLHFLEFFLFIARVSAS